MAIEQQEKFRRDADGINGDPRALETERAIEELRRGRTIYLANGVGGSLVAAIETLEPLLLQRLQSLEGSELVLLLTAERIRALNGAGSVPGPVAINLPQDSALETLRGLAGLAPSGTEDFASSGTQSAADRPFAEAGFRLAKAGRLLPALLAVRTNEAPDTGVVRVREKDVEHALRDNLILISRARVPLIDAVDTEIVLFRQRYGLGEHLAIRIGDSNASEAVPVRLHSACLTGDVLGSLRCDCGDQLSRAVGRMAAMGGGVLLYLDQEGRGIGLANKLRAYALQDAGLDTLDADQHLGFRSDERDYGVAASMLRNLDIGRIRLLTNNPDKLNALTEHGIDIEGRIPLIAPVNSHNRRYLEAKLDRAGHLPE